MVSTKIPIKVENQFCYKTVYSFAPQAFFGNEEQDTVWSLDKVGKVTKSKNVKYFTALNDGHIEIQSVVYKAGNHRAEYTFRPKFPDVCSLKEGINLKGKFTIGVDEIDGVVGGFYKISKNNKKVFISIEPQKCWQPMSGKDWVAAYKYDAVINLVNEEKYRIVSK